MNFELEKESHITEYINRTIDEVNTIFPMLIDVTKRKALISTYQKDNRPPAELEREIDQLKENILASEIEKRELRERYLTKAHKKLEEMSEEERAQKRLGQTLTFQMVMLFDILETLDKTGLSEEIKKARFMSEYERLKNSFYGPGYQDLDYETVKNIRKNILEDIDMITDEWSLKMTTTIKKDVPVLNSDYSLNEECLDFTRASYVCEYAKSHQKELKLHTLLWHQAFPESLSTILKDKTSSEKAEITTSFFRQYIASLASWAQEKGYHFSQIDVVNEIATDSKNQEAIYRDSKWTEAFGITPISSLPNDLPNEERKVQIALHDASCARVYATIFQIARSNFPTSKLLYNEYNEYLPHKCERICKIVNDLQQVGQKLGIRLIDGLGMQSHYFEYYVEGKDKTAIEEITPSHIYYTTEKYAGLNIELHRSEKDFEQLTKSSERKEKLEEAIELSDIALDIKSITAWNNNDLTSWRAPNTPYGSHMIDSKGKGKREYDFYVQNFSNKYYQRTNEINQMLKPVHSENNTNTTQPKTFIKTETPKASPQNKGFANSDALTIILGLIIISTIIIISSLLK